LDWNLPEAEADTIESQPDKPKARIQPMRNLIDDFMSKNQVRKRGDAQKFGCEVMKALKSQKTFTNYFIKFFYWMQESFSAYCQKRAGIFL
jgi:hypothetical protein